MVDTVDTAPSSSPADEAEEPQDAANADVAEEPQDAANADLAEKPQDAAPADEADQPQDARSAGVEGEAERREEEAEEPQDERSVTELLEQLGRDLSDLGTSEAQLEAARNLPEVRRAAHDITGALVVVVAALTAFAFLNVAAAEGLSRVLATWLAALIVAAVWIAVGGMLLFGFMGRARRWLLWTVHKAPPAEAVDELEHQRDAAIEATRTTLQRLGPAIAIQIAVAAVPKAGDVAGDVASGVVEVGSNALDASDEIVEVFAEQVPGGGVVEQIWGVALTPGRFGIKVATTILRRGKPPD